MLEPDISVIPDRLGEPRQWADPPQGSFDVWLPIEDLNGLREASITVARLRGKSYPNLSPVDANNRLLMLDLLGKLLTAERKLLLNEFAKYLGAAFAAEASQP